MVTCVSTYSDTVSMVASVSTEAMSMVVYAMTMVANRMGMVVYVVTMT